MSRRSLSMLVCMLFCALGVAACGSSKDESVNGLLKDTFAGGKKVKSGRLNVALDADVRGVKSLNGPIRLKLSGPFQSAGKNELPKFDFALGITSSGQTFTAGGVSLGDRGFVTFQDQAYSVSAKLFKQFKDGYLKAQTQSSSKSSAPSLSALGIDPRSWLVGARKAGETNVAGTTTTHIAAGINVPRLLRDLNRVLARARSVTSGSAQSVAAITPSQQRQLQRAVRTAKVDVYTGKDDHALRKLDVAVGLQRSGSLQGGNVHFTLEIDDLNQHQTVIAPRNAKPLDDLLTQLGGSTAGTSAGSGTATTTTPAPAPAPSSGTAANDAYFKCLQSAGQDLRKVQKCAALLK